MGLSYPKFGESLLFQPAVIQSTTPGSSRKCRALLQVGEAGVNRKLRLSLSCMQHGIKLVLLLFHFPTIPIVGHPCSCRLLLFLSAQLII